VKVIHVVTTMVITTGSAATATVALDVPALVQQARAVANGATCRSVDLAILAYLAEHGRIPTTTDELKPYARGDISGYRIEGGVAAGPGCPPATKP
jgi:hypothetical protein